MINIEKQIAFWREGANEDLAVAQELLERGRVRHGLFFAHLALEKAIKAHVCRRTQALAPRLHNLIRLAELAELQLSESQRDALAEMNAFAIEGRYPESLSPPPTQEEARSYMDRAKEGFECFMRLL